MILPETTDRLKIATSTFESQGRSIPVEAFEPSGGDAYPAVLVLHGADGLGYTGHRYREMARGLARHDYAAYVVHYFGHPGRSGASVASPLHFVDWMKVVSDAITYVADRPQVDAQGVGLLGVSLGAYLSLAVASQDERVGAVIECFGGLPDPFALTFSRMPPTLILHGEDDALVPVSEAHRLERLLQERGQVHEVKIYPGQGHGFTGSDSQDAFARSLAFLDRHLRGLAGHASAG